MIIYSFKNLHLLVIHTSIVLHYISIIRDIFLVTYYLLVICDITIQQ